MPQNWIGVTPRRLSFLFSLFPRPLRAPKEGEPRSGTGEGEGSRGSRSFIPLSRYQKEEEEKKRKRKKDIPVRKD